MRKKTEGHWLWNIGVFDTKLKKSIDIDDEFFQNYGMLSDDIGDAVEELRRKYYKRNKAKIRN